MSDCDPSESEAAPLEGRVLIAMPGIGDPRFNRAVILLCAHSEEGAMGVIVNKRAGNVTFPELLRQLDLEPGEAAAAINVRSGGPVEVGRGFVLHSPDYHSESSTMRISEDVSMTGTIDVLKAMAEGEGPARTLVALGYAGWAPGQLENELQENGWLTGPIWPDVVFDDEDETKWTRALGTLGIDPAALMAEGGAA